MDWFPFFGWIVLAMLVVSGYTLNLRQIRYESGTTFALHNGQRLLLDGLYSKWRMDDRHEPILEKFCLQMSGNEDDNTVTLMLRHSTGSLFGGAWEGGNVGVRLHKMMWKHGVGQSM